MFQTFRLLHIIALIFLNISLCLDAYVIYTTNAFEESAQKIATLHSETIPTELGLPALSTQIVYKEDVDMDTFIENLEDNFDAFDKKYLLIIGDETIISPHSAVQCDAFPYGNYTDDLFNDDFAIGRLLVKNNQEALNQINKIETYILDSNLEIWKNKVLLIADDENNPDEFDSEQEFRHTIDTDAIYNKLKDNTIINTLYGTHYLNQQSTFTDLIINNINSGVSLINYIGHGTLNNLAHENIFVLDRDINLINTNNRPPIWVVGTCSFGNYEYNLPCFAEELLKKPDAAIAIIATTAGVPSITSFHYLNKFYTKLSEELKNSHDLRIGDILKNAKNAPNIAYICMEYTYQLFGDPALPIIIPKQTDDIFETPNEITIGSQNHLEVNYGENSYIKIVAEDIIYNMDINDNESIEYKSPGGTLFESYFSNEINYYVPFEITAEKARIIIYNTQNDNRSNNYEDIIQFSDLITLQNNTNDINQELLEDTQGPSIRIYNNEIELVDNISIFPPYNFRIDISDNLPINMSGSHNHNLIFWINDEKHNALILNDMFNPTSETSGSVILNFEDSRFDEESYDLNVESWDILNNHTLKNIRINVNEDLQPIFNVYNFPNPFYDKTFFTFHMRDPQPIDIKIILYSKTGRKITTLEKSIDETKSYHVFPESGWDGTDKYHSQLKNGTYFYHLNIKTLDQEILHDKIHKLTILK